MEHGISKIMVFKIELLYNVAKHLLKKTMILFNTMILT
jgi:hypothetical protein